MLLLFVFQLMSCQQVAEKSAVADTGTINIDFWYGPDQHFGQLGTPQRWINILGNIAATDSLLKATYSLNEGPEMPLSLGSNLHRLALPGDFNVELAWDDLITGTNQLSVAAYSRGDTVVRKSLQFEAAKGNTWPLPYAVDFSEVDRLQDVVQIVDGHWSLEKDGVRTRQRYYDRVLSMGDTVGWSDYATTVHLTVNDYTPSEPGPPTYNVTHFGVAMRWRGHHADGRQPSRKWYPLGAQGEFLIKARKDSCQFRILFDGGRHKPPTFSERLNNLVIGQPMVIKTQVVTLPDERTRYRFKQWMADQPEPDGWDVEGFETDDYASGALCLVPHNSDVTIHRVVVEPLTNESE